MRGLRILKSPDQIVVDIDLRKWGPGLSLWLDEEKQTGRLLSREVNETYSEVSVFRPVQDHLHNALRGECIDDNLV